MSYVSDQLELAIKNNPNEPEFIQAITEVLQSLEPVSYTHLATFAIG